MDHKLVFETAFPKAVYKPLGIPVEIREVSFQRDGALKTYLIYTTDGSMPFSWRSYVGGEGYITKYSDWAWVSMSDLGIPGICSHPEEARVIVHTTVDNPVGFGADGVNYSEEADAFERCSLCGTITREHVLTHEEE